MKLNLGSGPDYKGGVEWINVDVRNHIEADVHQDYRTYVTKVADEAVDEVLMSHSLGYCSLYEARKLFRELCRILAPSGLLVIEGPDAIKCAHVLVASDTQATNGRYLAALGGLFGFDAQDTKEGCKYPPYAMGWSVQHLLAELTAAGFSVATSKPRLHPPPCEWRDYRVEARKP